MVRVEVLSEKLMSYAIVCMESYNEPSRDCSNRSIANIFDRIQIDYNSLGEYRCAETSKDGSLPHLGSDVHRGRAVRRRP